MREFCFDAGLGPDQVSANFDTGGLWLLHGDDRGAGGDGLDGLGDSSDGGGAQGRAEAGMSSSETSRKGQAPKGLMLVVRSRCRSCQWPS